MSDPFYVEGDIESPFFREDFAERRDAALLAHLRAGGSPLTFKREAGKSLNQIWRDVVINLEDAVLSQPGAMK